MRGWKYTFVFCAAAAICLSGTTQAEDVKLNSGLLAESMDRTAQPADLRFEKNGDVTYIYCNNHESIRQENIINLTDDQVSGRSFLMSMDRLKPGKYVMFVSHDNETAYKYYSDTEMAANNFEIFLDARFQSMFGARVRIKRAGYWTMPEKRESWAAIPAWANFFGQDIYQIGMPAGESLGHSTLAKEPMMIPFMNYAPTMMNFENGIAWIGDYMPGKVEPCMTAKPVFMIAEFEVLGGETAYINIDIGALKSVEGNIAKSREMKGRVRDASVIPEYQIKGIAAYAPEVTAQPMQYTVTDETRYLPVTVYNSLTGDEGKTLENGEAFLTYGSPKGDTYHMGDRYAGSDMLNFTYQDTNPGGKTYRFDPETPWNMGNGVTTCQLGNFGVMTRYTLKLKNTARENKTFVYRMTTASNYLVHMRSSSLIGEGNPNGEYRTEDGYSLFARNEVEYKDADYMSMIKAGVNIVRCPLPRGETTVVELEIISPTNVLGGLENQFIIE